MEQCVMTPGTIKMPLSSAINWDSPLTVSLTHHLNLSQALYIIQWGSLLESGGREEVAMSSFAINSELHGLHGLFTACNQPCPLGLLCMR